jgi:hypothetical protein
MKHYFEVHVECKEEGRWVEAGTYRGIATTIDQAMQKADQLALKDTGADETRVVKAEQLGPVEF